MNYMDAIKATDTTLALATQAYEPMPPRNLETSGVNTCPTKSDDTRTDIDHRDQKHETYLFRYHVSEEDDELDDDLFDAVGKRSCSPGELPEGIYSGRTVARPSKAEKLLGLPPSRKLQYFSSNLQMSDEIAPEEGRTGHDGVLMFASISTFSPFGEEDLDATSEISLDAKTAQKSVEMLAEGPHRLDLQKRPIGLANALVGLDDFLRADTWTHVTYKHGPIRTRPAKSRDAKPTLAGWGDLWNPASTSDTAWIDDVLDHFCTVSLAKIGPAKDCSQETNDGSHSHDAELSEH